MIRLTIHEATTRLSKYLDRLAKRETIAFCERNMPVAEIRALPCARKAPRPVGLAKNELKIPNTFFDPLPSDLLDAFGRPRLLLDNRQPHHRL
jgi:antitoxin (DNA-binding transcriptional repressor) of toxin-antitoxin stability system